MVFLIFPFTLFLLLYPLLELSNEKCRRRLSWFSFKLKPFFDSYRAPYTSFFCFWPGVLLVIRIGLAISVALSNDVFISFEILFAVLVFLISILSMRKIYKSETQLQILDAAFLASLLFLAYLYDNTSGGIALYGTIIILSFAFIMFFCILVYHVWMHSRLKRLCKCINMSNTKVKDEIVDVGSSLEVNDQVLKRFSSTIVNVNNFNELRESLLEEPYTE